MNIANDLARRMMKNPKQRAFRSAILVITLSVVPLVFISQLSQAMIEGIISRFLETYTYHLQVTSFMDPTFMEAEKILKDEPLVKDTYRELRSYALAFSEQGRMSVELRGIEAQLHNTDRNFRKYLTIEPLNATLEESEVWIGQETARNLGLEVGDTMRFLIASEDVWGSYQPRIVRARVTAIVSTGYQNLDESWIFLSFEWANLLIEDWQDQYIFGVKVTDPYSNIKRTRAKIQEKLDDNYMVYDWQVLNKNELISLSSSQGVLLFLLIVIVFVAIANTIGVLQLFHLEQLSSLATLTFLGMRRSQFFQLYLFVSFWASWWGVIIGTGAGVVLAYAFVYTLPWIEEINRSWAHWLEGHVSWVNWPILDLSFYLRGIELRLRWSWLLMTFISVILLTVFMSLIPAWRTSSMKPMQILRKI